MIGHTGGRLSLTPLAWNQCQTYDKGKSASGLWRTLLSKVARECEYQICLKMAVKQCRAVPLFEAFRRGGLSGANRTWLRRAYGGDGDDG